MLAISLLVACDLSNKNKAEISNQPSIIDSQDKLLATVDEVLSHVNYCNDTIIIRSQALTDEMIEQSCELLIAKEKRFHQLFSTENKPVPDDHNKIMRANIYHTRNEFVKYATNHFIMPTNNGGMYLEGFPDKPNNQAEFVAYEREGEIWNLRHEYIHYLDSRFNKYGDYCNGLHDDHDGPEFCSSPHLTYPHIVWWTEGIAEYIAKEQENPKALKLAAQKSFQLSELFNTSSNDNSGTERVYCWGYLAVRFMMETHREDIEKMLVLIRIGDWLGYQDLIRSWGTNFDNEFHLWLDSLTSR